MADAAETRLRPYCDALAAAEAAVTAARQARDTEIRACVRDHLPRVLIARAAGISRQYVYDIAGDLLTEAVVPR